MTRRNKSNGSRITSDTAIEDFKKNYGITGDSKRRGSDVRETQLRKFAQLRSRNPGVGLRLTQDPHKGFAHVEWSEDDSDPTIEVTKKEIPQNVTDLPREYFDYLHQKGLTIHEVGHILYTDWPSFKEESEKDTVKNKQTLKEFWNIFEDGAIENFLRDDYRVEEEIDLIRKNLAEGETSVGEVREVNGEENRYVSMKEAINAAIYDMAVWNTGTLSEIESEDGDIHFTIDDDKEEFDDFLPTIKAYVDAIVNEPDAEDRNRFVRQFYEEAQKVLDEADVSGENKDSNPQEGMPDDAHEGMGKQQKQPDSAGGGQSDESGAQSEAGDEDEGEAGAGGDEPQDPGEGQTPGEARAEESDEGDDAKEKAESGLNEEMEALIEDELEDEVEKFIEAMAAGDGSKEMIVPTDNELNTRTYNKAKRQSRQVAQTLDERLRLERKERMRRRVARGAFDAKEMIRASRGFPDVFKTPEDKGDKNYAVTIVKDSSGSTSGFSDEIEVAAGTMAIALEEVGVDVCVLDVEHSKVTLAKPFGSSCEQNRENIFNGVSSGGTPLRHAVWFARERMHMGKGDEQFMIVLTDGRPRKGNLYREELKKCRFPVVGLYIDKNRTRSSDAMKSFRDDFDYFHNQGCVFKDENTLTRLNALCQRMMF